MAKRKRKGQNVEKLEVFILGLDIETKIDLLNEFNISFFYPEIDEKLLKSGMNSPTKYQRIIRYWD